MNILQVFCIRIVYFILYIANIKVEYTQLMSDDTLCIYIKYK